MLGTIGFWVQFIGPIGEIEMKSSEVTQALVEADTAAQKATAKRKLNKYLKEREEAGTPRAHTLAGINASVSRKRNIVAKKASAKHSKTKKKS